MMRIRQFITIVSLAAGLVAGNAVLVAQNARTEEAALKVAQQKEEVRGDLKGAIEDYKKLALSKDKAIAAKALLRLADCYRKSGDAEATKIYEQLVREFGGQPEAAEARTRLAAATRSSQTSSATGWAQHRVTTTPTLLDDTGGVSSDGRFLAFTTPSWAADDEGGLMVRDIQAGRDRRVVANSWFKTKEQVDYKAAFSRDGKQLAYTWFTPGPPQLRVVRLDVNGVPVPRTLLNLDDVGWVTAHDWSPDGTSIAVGVIRGDRSHQVGLVSSQDGAFTVLKSVNWDDGSQMRFSPDGKYLAFGHVGPDRQGDIMVLAVDGSREIAAVVQPGSDSVLGWSADGKHLVFLSDRTGQPEIWSQSFADGHFGQPAPLTPRAGGVDFNGIVGLSASGTLFYAVRPDLPRFDIKTAAVDFSTGRLIGPPALAVPEHVGSNWLPSWSHDGKLLAYQVRRSSGSEVLTIRALDGDNRARELRPKLTSLGAEIRWSADDASLIVEASDFDGRDGLYSVNVQTGDATPLMRFANNELPGGAQLGRTGSTIYFLRRMSPGIRPVEKVDFALFRRDVASGTETQIFRATQFGRGGGVTNYAVSPDGKMVYFTRALALGGPAAVIARDLATGVERELAPSTYSGGQLELSPDGRFIVRNGDWRGKEALLLIPTGPGEPRALNSAGARAICWSPDSRSILMRDRPTGEMWWVPIDGRERVKLSFDLADSVAYQFQAHPDGRRVVFTHSISTGPATGPGRNRSSEVWTLENFLPAPGIKR